MNNLCAVAVSEGPIPAEDQPQTLQDASCLLLNQKKYCDVTFTFPNLPDRIEAHELFLKARSPVFEQIFRMRKSGNVHGKEIEISESTPARLQEFLEFIYTDKFDTNVAGALDLLPLAQKYKIQPLTNKCEELLKTEIKVEDSVQAYETARRYGRKELVDQAGDIMVKLLANLIEKDALVDAEETTLVYLLERDDLPVKEVELFECVLKWGRNQILSSNGDQSLQDKLKKVAPLTRYTNMSPYEFKSKVLPTGLLSGEEIISVYSYFAEDEAMRKNMKIRFNTTRRNPEAFVDFYGGNEDASLRCSSTACNPLKLSISFQVKTCKKLWSYSILKKLAITAIKVKWPFRDVKNSRISDESLNFNVYIKELSRPVNDKHVTVRFVKNLINCKGGEEAEILVQPGVEIISGVTYCVTVEDQSIHHSKPRCCCRCSSYDGKVKYTYSGIFSPNELSPETSVVLGGIDLKLNEIQKDNRLSGFSYSTADFPINVIRGIKVALV